MKYSLSDLAKSGLTVSDHMDLLKKKTCTSFGTCLSSFHIKIKLIL